MSKNEQLRPQPVTSDPWYKKAALPWIIILVMAIATTAFIGGWVTRSNYVVTPADVRAQVLEQLAVKK